MALPPIFDRLRLPVIGSPLFIVSGPETMNKGEPMTGRRRRSKIGGRAMNQSLRCVMQLTLT